MSNIFYHLATDPMSILEMFALCFTACYVGKITFHSDAENRMLKSGLLFGKERERSSRLSLFWEVGTLISLPKQSLRKQRR